MFLKGQCQEIFCFWFFHESVSHQPQSIPLRPFWIFWKFAEIFASQGAPPVSTTPAANFSSIFTSVVDTDGKFAPGVNDTGGKYFKLQSTVNLKQNFWTCSVEWPYLRDITTLQRRVPLNYVTLLTLKNLSRGVGDNCFSKMIFLAPIWCV
jgi:hypothetical protein